MAKKRNIGANGRVSEYVKPYAQTQYLGCSVVNFTMNLGWGASSSSCNVTLAADYSSHWNSTDMAPMHTELANQNQKPGLTDKDTVTNSQAFNSDTLEKTDASKSLFRNLISKEKAKYDTLRSQNNAESESQHKDVGKKCWNTIYGAGNVAPANWFDPDPGFIGNKNHYAGQADIDIVGCPTFFRFDDTWFGGVIKSWKYSDGTYNVTLGSFSDLLKGCKMILSKYRGSVTTRIPNTAGAIGGVGDISVPYNDTSLALADASKYKTTPYQGNIPNLFNIFGWLEASGFGNSGYTEEKGIPATVVYDTLYTFLSGTVGDPGDSSLSGHWNDASSTSATLANGKNVTIFGPNHGQWSPFGAIVAKTPLRRDTGGFLNPYTATFATNVGLTGKPTANSAQINFTEMGLVRTVKSTDGNYRSLFRLDMSMVPRPPAGAFINDDSMDILSFIEYCCDNAGCDFYLDFYPDNAASNFSGVIQVNVVTRRVQPLPNVIKNFILGISKEDQVTEFNFGEEFNDTKSRSVLIGGPQQRLYQANTNTAGQMKQRKVFEPALNSWADASFMGPDSLNNSFRNTFREPDPTIQRAFSDLRGLNYKSIGGAVVAQEHSRFFNQSDRGFNNSVFPRGSYLSVNFPNLGSATSLIGSSSSYPLYKDIISPYFGYGADGEPRNTYYDRRTRQMQVVINFQDIAAAFPTPYQSSVNANWSPQAAVLASRLAVGGDKDVMGNSPVAGNLTVGYGKLVVEENEIRAAMTADSNEEVKKAYEDKGAMATWLAYTADKVTVGAATAMSRLIYSYVARNWSSSIALALLTGMGSETLATAIGQHQDNVHTALRLSVIPAGRTAYQRLRSFNSVSPAAQAEGLSKILENIHGFLANLGNTYYGKTYGVRIPNVSSYFDGGRVNFSHEICDYAWEEPGNMIDNTMMVGSNTAAFFQQDGGKISPILGFDNTGEKAFAPGLFNMGPQLQSQSMIDGGFGALTSASHGVYSPIVTDAPEDTYINVPNQPINVGTLNQIGTIYTEAELNSLRNLTAKPAASTSTHGTSIPDNFQYKMYVKATVVPENPANIFNPKIIYDNGAAKVVMQAPGGMFIAGTNTTSDSQDASLSVMFSKSPILQAALGAIFLTNAYGQEMPAEIQGNPIGPVTIWGASPAAAGLAAKYLTASIANNSAPFQARAAIPTFAAIPIKYNLATYGPWVSHPGSIKSTVFPSLTQNNLDIALINNLVGGVDVTVDQGLVPWEFGGIDALDSAALLRVSENNEFQQVLEAGSITLAGVMMNNARIGSSLLAGSYAPIVTSVSVSIGDNITTRYELRTFSRKIGFYNKEAADNIKFFNQKFIAANQRIQESQRTAVEKATFVGNRLGGGY